ncbi:MAG: efflux RND transporter periplasmic adaptor subunit [Planctomycetia bacterium]|nr:efflux RND transporter periplasmic adaptor subunit [Planctomycetia bacterium]
MKRIKYIVLFLFLVGVGVGVSYWVKNRNVATVEAATETGEAPALTEGETGTETFVETPVEAPADIPAEIPAAEIPVETPAETPVETSAPEPLSFEAYSPEKEADATPEATATATEYSPSIFSSTPAAAVETTHSTNDTGYITLIDDIEVPAEEAGVLVELNVQEGTEVKKGDTLARIDDDKTRMAMQVAEAKLKSAQRQASNDVNIRYAKAASQVAYAEILQSEEANKKTTNTVTQAELRRQILSYKQAELQIEQATHEYTCANFAVEVQQAELDAAKVDVKKRTICSPLDGIVVERFRNAGEWVKPGDPLLRLIRMDTVRVKFLLDAQTVPMAGIRGKTVQVTVPILPGKTFSGKVTFVSPLIESGTRYQVWAEIQNVQENGVWTLQPGMQANASVQ